MVKYMIGDLIEAHKKGQELVIAHQANCFCKMGSGIARQLAKEFPSAMSVDSNTVEGDARKLGSFTMTFTHMGAIFNLYGQYKPGKNTDYEYLRESLRSMSIFLQGGQSIFPFCKKNRIALPKIGAGIGGGDWSIIEKIIQEELSTFEVVIYVLNESELPVIA